MQENQLLPKALLFNWKLLAKMRLQAAPTVPVWEKAFSKPEAINEQIAQWINAGQPAMIARYGAGELQAVIRYQHMLEKKFSAFRYLFYKDEPGWWTADIKASMPVYNGFFPTTEANLNRFGTLMLEDTRQVDILGSWLTGEAKLAHRLQHVQRAELKYLEPYFSTNPWSQALEGKTVLVVHPFEASIQHQFNRRQLLFADSRILPSFTLKTIKAVQSLAGGNGGFTDWFAALEWMKNKMDSIAYDVAIIGCGAYGLPLAAHAKRQGKVGIHLGGATQVLFGIKGARWEERPEFSAMMNEYWVKPLEEERPAGAEKVEGACYW